MGKIYPLKQSSLFEKVFTEGERYKDSFIKLYILPNNQGIIRVGISIPRQIKGAVVRNKIKRRLKEIIRRFAEQIKGYDIVIVPDLKIKEKSFSEILQKIENMVKNLK